MCDAVQGNLLEVQKRDELLGEVRNAKADIRERILGVLLHTE